MKGNGLRRLRLARGLSAAQLAEAVGASEAEVLRWEAGELPPSGKLLALSAALGAEVEDILRAAQEGADTDEGVAGEANAAQSDGPAAQSDGSAARGDGHAADSGDAAQGGAEPLDVDRLRAEGAPEWLRAEGEREAAQAQKPAPEKVKERLSSPANGFTRGERIFGYIVCLLAAAAAIFVLVWRFVPQERPLTMDNYERYCTLSFQRETYGITAEVTSEADIENFSMVIEVELVSMYDIHNRVTRTVTLADSFLETGETLRGSAEDFMFMYGGHTVVSIGGTIV